jgi:hypothetical protein
MAGILKAERLGQFIGALSRGERKYFREKHSATGGQKVYLEIFDYLESHPGCSNSEFLVHFQGRAFMRNPASAGHYLEDLLCQSLESYHRHGVGNLSIHAELQAAKTLAIRGFNKQAIKRLSSIEKRAEAQSEWHLLAEALWWKSKSVARNADSVDMLEEVLKLAQKRQFVVQQMEVALRWELKHVEFLQRIFKQGVDDAASHLVEFKEWVSLHAAETEGNFDARYFQLWILGRISRLERNAKDTLQYRRELLLHVETKKDWSLINPTPYITILSNLGSSALELGDESVLDFVLSKMKEFDSLDPDQSKLSRLLSCFLRLTHLVKNGRFQPATDMIPEAIEAYKQGGHMLVKINQAVVMYYFAFVQFVGRNYRETLRWLLNIEQDLNPRDNLDLICTARLLRLIVYHETGNHDQLGKQAREVAAFLKREAAEKQFELALCDYLGGQRDKSQQIENKALTDLLKSFPGASTFHQGHLKAWVEAQVSGKKLEQILLPAKG